MTEQPPKKILELIRRLLALSTSSNEHEAAAAASKAQELLLKYNLEMSHIPQDKGDEVERWDFLSPHTDQWLDFLINAVCSANLCRVVKGYEWRDGTRDGNRWIAGTKMRKFYLFGKKPNLEVAEFMYAYLAGEIDRLTPKKQKKAWINSFRLGAVTIISKRLREELQTFQSTEETKALVVVSDQALSTAVKKDFPKLYSGRGMSVSDYGAYNDGQAAGKTVQFRQGINGGSANAAGQALIG